MRIYGLKEGKGGEWVGVVRCVWCARSWGCACVVGARGAKLRASSVSCLLLYFSGIRGARYVLWIMFVFRSVEGSVFGVQRMGEELGAGDGGCAGLEAGLYLDGRSREG